MWQGTHPIAPDRRELSPQVTEGASGQETDDLLSDWYLLEVIVTRLQLFSLLSNQPSASACQQGLTFLLRQESKESCPAQGGNNSLPLELFPP